MKQLLLAMALFVSGGLATADQSDDRYFKLYPTLEEAKAECKTATGDWIQPVYKDGEIEGYICVQPNW